MTIASRTKGAAWQLPPLEVVASSTQSGDEPHPLKSKERL
jgi:hypothetical protein